MIAPQRSATANFDGLYVKLKRSTVDGEVIYFAMGIDEDGHRQILNFYVGQESANGWKDVLIDHTGTASLLRSGTPLDRLYAGDDLTGRGGFLQYSHPRRASVRGFCPRRHRAR